MQKMFFPILTDSDKKLPFFLHSVGCNYNQEPVNRPGGYPYYQWIQCFDGEGILILDNEEYEISPGQGFFLFPHHPHEYYPVNSQWKVDWFAFGVFNIEDSLKLFAFEKSKVLSVYDVNRILSEIRKLYNSAISDSPFKSIECSTLIYQILADIRKCAYHPGDNSFHVQYSKLEKVLKYIEKNYQDPISINDLADILDVTPQHFCVLFKKIMKVRPLVYVSNLRIQKSKELFFNKVDTKIDHVAKKVGFEDSSYFCSVFKKYEGISPGAFKKLHGL